MKRKQTRGKETKSFSSTAKFKGCAEFIVKTYDQGIYRVGDFLGEIEKQVPQQKLDKMKAKSKVKITHEDLDVAMGYHWACINAECSSNDERYMAPVQGMATWFKNLKSLGLHNRKCTLAQAKCLREVLVKIGYITLIDPRYSNKTGEYMKWAIGVDFPKYQEYRDLGIADRALQIQKELEAQLQEAHDSNIFWTKKIEEVERQLVKLTGELDQAKGAPQEDEIRRNIKRLQNRDLTIAKDALPHSAGIIERLDWREYKPD
jgi:hypothetical protein